MNEGFSGRGINNLQREMAVIRQDLRNMNNKIEKLKKRLEQFEISEQDRDLTEEKYKHQYD